jgi:hypothetical protein
VLPLFKQHSDDTRPQHAIEIARAWANGAVSTGTAMKASVAAHAAARQMNDKAAVAAARAAGHAVATGHFADHSMGALLYAVKALKASGETPEAELELQLRKLPAHLLEPVSSGIGARVHRIRIRGSAAG